MRVLVLVPVPGAYLRSFDLVPRRTAPALQVREDFAFLPVKARMHLAPPLLLHDGGWRGQGRRRNFTFVSFTFTHKIHQLGASQFGPSVTKMGLKIAT